MTIETAGSPRRRRVGAIGRALRVTGLLAAVLALSGCVVYPAYPRYAYHYRPYPGYYYYR